MAVSGYIVVGILMLLTIIAIALCEITNNEELKPGLEGILIFLVVLVLVTMPV